MQNKTAFLNIFGDTPILRVLDFLIVNEDFDYSMTDIANLSGIGYSTLKLFWKKLEEIAPNFYIREKKYIDPFRNILLVVEATKL